MTITKNNFATLQQRNVEFARTWMTGGIELARAYQNLFSPFSYAIYAQQSLKAAQQTTQLTREALQATEQALKATQQELRVAEKATVQAEKATAKAEKDTIKAERTNAKTQAATREATLRVEEETREVALQSAVHSSLKTKDYEELNVDEVSKRLDGLSAAELKKVREYEKHNKNRDTLIEQIDRKTQEETREVALQSAVHSSLKTKDYEELNVDEVSKRLDGLSAAELKKVREYEKHNKNRDTLVEQIDRKMKATA